MRKCVKKTITTSSSASVAHNTKKIPYQQIFHNN